MYDTIVCRTGSAIVYLKRDDSIPDNLLEFHQFYAAQQTCNLLGLSIYLFSRQGVNTACVVWCNSDMMVDVEMMVNGLHKTP